MSTRRINLLLVLGISLSVLLPAQFCSAQLSVQGYAGDDDHIGWAVSADNTGCKRDNLADLNYEQKGGTRAGLYRFNGLQQQCSNNQYGCYALVKGTYSNGRVGYSYVSGPSGVTTKEQAIEAATDGAFASVSVLVAGCIPKPPEPAKPAPTTSSGTSSDWITNDCFRKLTYQYRTKELLDLTPQFHYYFQAKNDYPVTVYFILSLKDADGRERFGTRHTIAPGATIQFVEKMDKNYIRSMAIERVRFRTDVGDYAACGDDPSAADAAKTTPANKPPTTNGIDLTPQAIKQKILDNLKANIRAGTLTGMQREAMEITDVSVDSDGDGVRMHYSFSQRDASPLVPIFAYTQTENASFDQMARGLSLDGMMGYDDRITHLKFLVVDGDCSNSLVAVRMSFCKWIYDTGPNQQNYYELKALIAQLNGGPSSIPSQNTANTSQPVNSKPVANTPPTSTPPALITPEQYLDRGNSFIEQGKYDLAIADYNKAIQMNPNNADAYHNRGVAYANNGSYDLAIADHTKAIQLDPNAADAYDGRGVAYAQKKSYDLAIADFTRAIQIDPNDGDAYSGRGHTYYSKGNYDLAIVDDSKAIQLDPNNALAYYERGRAYVRTNTYELAISDFTKSIQIKPNSSDAYRGRGLAYARSGSYDLAIADYNKAIGIDPNNDVTYNNRAQAYIAQGSYDLAIADYTKAIQIDPTGLLNYLARAGVYVKKGSSDLAIADYTKAIQIRPDYAETYYDRGVLYADKGSYDLAIADYTKAIRMDPTATSIYTYRALAYANKGSYDLAIDQTRAAELDPKNVDVYKNLAWTYLYLGKAILAHQQATKYLELNGLAGDGAPYAIIIGYIGLLKSGDSAKASEFLSGWLKQVKDDAWSTKILRYFQGEITVAQLLAFATDNDKLTAAHSYIGEIQLINKTPDTAKVHFEWVRANGNKGFFEYTLAVAELKRLGQ